MARRPISAIIICYNEVDNISEAIDSVSWCEEVLVVDSYSDDGTLERIKEKNVRLLQHAFEGFTEQKNWAIEQSAHEWILLIDADERLTSALKTEVERVLSEESISEEAFWIYRDNFFMGKRLKHNWQNDKVIRLFQRHCRYEKKSVHEEIEVNGTTGSLKGRLKHDTYKGKGFLVHLEKGNRYTTLAAQDRYLNVGRVSLYHLWFRPFVTFFKHYFFRFGFLDGREGFVIASLSAWNVFQRYVKIWRLKEGEKLEA